MINPRFSVKQTRNTLSIQYFFAIWVGGGWFLALAVKKWIGISLFSTAAFALFILANHQKQAILFFQENKLNKKLFLLSIALASPLFAILLGQLFRQDFYAAAYDSSLRFFLTIPILYAMVYKKINTFKFFEYAVPNALFASLLSLLIKPNLFFLAQNRVSTYFIDPILFGSICLTLALMSLISINLSQNDSLFFKLIKVAGFFTGLYLSIISGSRTGWAAIPIVLLLWIYIRFNKKNFFIGLALLIFFMSCLWLTPTVQQRINLAVYEISSYQWSSLNSDTSVGLRISFIRIGFFLFSHNIFSGWGDNGFKNLLNAPELCKFATAYARNFTLTAGFHNEIIANMVKSGIWGLISSLLIFLVPFCLFIKGLSSTSHLIRHCALMAISYLICVFISAMTIEVFSSKLSASFHAMIMINLISSLLVMMYFNQNSEKI
jgi:O-antigen ligase